MLQHGDGTGSSRTGDQAFQADTGVAGTVGGRTIYALTHEFYPRRAGIGIYVEEIARAATTLGYPIEVWAPEAARLRDGKGFPFPIRALPLRGSEDLPCLWRLSKEIHRHRHELREGLLYLPEPGPVRACMLLALFAEIPARSIVLTLHGSEIVRYVRHAYLRLAFGRLLRRADRIGVVSGYTRELLLKSFPFTRDKIRLVPGALRHDFVDAPQEDLRLDKSKIIILTVARIHPRKGQLAVIEALSRLPARLKQRMEYRLAGRIDKEKYLRRLREAAHNARIALHFVGEVADDELPGLYSHADIFAMTSMPYKDSVEGFGLAYLEAGASGLPVVAHDIGGVSDAVRHGETGILVSSDDRVGLAQAIQRLSEDGALREKMSINARERAYDRSWAENADILFNGL